MKEKLISVRTDNQLFKIGEEVNVVMEEKKGFYAVLFAYVLPFILMISILLIGNSYKMNELYMGLTVVLFLVFYYLLLFLFRNRFENKISFKIEKQNNN